MILSKERLLKESRATGFRAEILEKVAWLMHLLNHISEDSYLKSRLALKGGTALNLFYFDLPRLSVDADFNYVGALDRDAMLVDRPVIEERLKNIFQRIGLTLDRNPTVHAGGKMRWRYPSALGNQGNLEVDLNYMYRAPLLPPVFLDSIVLANQKVSRLLVLDIHEVAAGKFSALFDRGLGRDLFDAAQLLRCNKLDQKLFRQCLLPYIAMSSKRRALDIQPHALDIELSEIKNKLIPVLKTTIFKQEKEIDVWVEVLSRDVKNGLFDLLPFSEAETTFLKAIEKGEVIGTLLSEDDAFVRSVNSHPALQWRIAKEKH